MIADIGGTNARFALAHPDQSGYQGEQILKCADFNTPEDAMRHYLEQAGIGNPDAICLAVAGPVINGSVEFTNSNWHLREQELSTAFGGVSTRVVNDFEAMAYSLPRLPTDDLAIVGLEALPALNERNFTVGVIGPGTGLGGATLAARNGIQFSLCSEVGRVGFSPETALQKAVWEVLRHRFGRVSAERMVSGSGIENIYTALSEIHDQHVQPTSAAEIFGQTHENNLARETISLFFAMLGQVAGNFALATGAFDGIYIGGGIVQRYESQLMESGFRAGFENKGRHRYLMEQIPVALIRNKHPGLIGAVAVASELLGSNA